MRKLHRGKVEGVVLGLRERKVLASVHQGLLQVSSGKKKPSWLPAYTKGKGKRNLSKTNIRGTSRMEPSRSDDNLIRGSALQDGTRRPSKKKGKGRVAT